MRTTTNASPDHPTTSGTLLHRIARRVRGRPDPKDPALEDIAIIEASGRFDKQWYLRHYPDVAESGIDPVQHYVRHGAAEGRDPTGKFSTEFYLHHNPDVASSGINPFRHYIEHGHGENRAGKPTAIKAGQPESNADTIAQSGVFDSTYYLATYPMVAATGLDPVLHYLQHGAAEGHKPNVLFDTRYYLKNNPDVAKSGMNPLLHFCRHGFRELRNPSPKFDIGWYWLTYLPEDVTTNPLAHYLQQGIQDGLEIRSAGKLEDEDKQTLSDSAVRVLEQKQTYPTEVYVRLGLLLVRLEQWSYATTAFSKALAQKWNNARVHARLAEVFAKQGKWWQAVESWASATNLDPGRANWFFHLGEAQEKMNRFAQAAEAYQKAVEMEPDHPYWHYLLGYVYEKAGQRDLAETAYAEAVARDTRQDVKAFGVGILHEARKYWADAAEAYARELQRQPDCAELYFRLGMAQDRCYRWPEAQSAFRNAIALNPTAPYWNYRYGFVLERQHCWLEAAEAYAAAFRLKSKPTAYWKYRQGYALAKAGKYTNACVAYLETTENQNLAGETPALAQPTNPLDAESVSLNAYLDKFPSEELISAAIARDTTKADWYYQLGQVRERKCDWSGAASAYGDAVARSNQHRPSWYYRLGFVLFRAGRFEEATQAFRETRGFRLPYGVDTRGYSKDPVTRGNMQYREHLDTLPLQPLTILYESTHGAVVGGNPYAIFEHLLDHPEYKNWTHVWAVAADVVIPDHLRSRANVIFVEYGNDLYRRYLATVSHLVNDTTFPYWFSRRPEQKYLNTWHGTPFKAMGKPIRSEDEFMSHRNIQRNLLHATHLLSPGPHTSDMMMDNFEVRGICTAKLAETGYPRVDRTLNASPERIAWVRKRLGLSGDDPVALYAPTWRGIFGQTELDLERLRRDLTRLADVPCQWVFRGHPFTESILRDAGIPVTIAPKELDTADVLAATDLLVTDYSSISFDFIATRRPIFYYCYDLDEYKDSRGLCLDIHEMPGTACRDIDALVTSIELQLANGQRGDDTYDTAMERFCPHDDGHATARAVDFFLHDNDDYNVTRYQDKRPSLLFFGGHFAPNGINTSFLNLMQALQESGQYCATVAIEPNRVKNEPAWLEDFRRLPDEAKVLGRVGRMVTNAEQRWVGARFRASREFPSLAMREVFQSAYRDEFRRCFGDARFDAVVDFDGYNPYWTTLFGLGADTRKACWLHNDFYEEFTLKHPYIKSLFTIYPDYDSLVSVSERMEQVNREKLAQRLKIPNERFTSCINIINSSSIQARAKAPVDPDLVPWFEGTTTFLTMGRMSPEKDQAKLVDAFSQVHDLHPEARLIILGDGPLRTALEQQVKQLGLENSICLAGQRSNPFPALQRCDCFVLSSNHEGQPMVLLEALALGKPIVATDIDGNRGVLKGGYGHMVDNNTTGLKQGMLDFLAGDLKFRPFDAKAYRKEALDEFESIVAPVRQSRSTA